MGLPDGVKDGADLIRVLDFHLDRVAALQRICTTRITQLTQTIAMASLEPRLCACVKTDDRNCVQMFQSGTAGAALASHPLRGSVDDAYREHRWRSSP